MTPHTIQRTAQNTSLIQNLSLVAICNACLDVYLRQAIELCVLVLLLLLFLNPGKKFPRVVKNYEL